VEGDVAEDGEGAAVVASTLRHRECSVTVLIALFQYKYSGDFFEFFLFFSFEKILLRLSLSNKLSHRDG